MTLEQLIAMGLSEEVAKKVLAASQEELKSFIPKARFDEVNEAKKQAEEGLKERDKQLKELGEKAKGNEELTKKIEELQNANKEATDKYEASMKELKLNTALKIALTGTAHDPDIVANLLDKTKIELDDNGNIKAGLDDQMKSLKESKAFLFVPKENNKSIFKGFKPAESKEKGDEGGDNQAGEIGKRLAEMVSKGNEGLSQARESYFK